MAFVHWALVYKSIFLLLFFTISPLSMALPQLKEVSNPLPSYHPTESQIQSIIDNLSLAQKVGQLFIFGFSGTTFKKSLQHTLVAQSPGALIAFKRNVGRPHQLAKMNEQSQNLSLKLTGLPLFIMVDQEGGTVTRIKTRPLPPSALSIGMTKQPELAQKTGRITGQLLSYLGFTMNLAPVLDLSDPYKRNFIGNRSFGDDPETVKIMATNFALGLSDAGVLPAGKHFPGHGGIVADSHRVLPTKTITLESLRKKDLIPFEHFAKQNMTSAMMVAHIAFPNLDPTGLPATYSSPLVTGILRDDLKYNGLIITDDIEMKGAEKIGNIGKRAVKAIQAGCDMVMVAWSKQRQKQALAAVITAVEKGEISLERIHKSLNRIVKIKLEKKNLGLPRYLGKKKLKSQMRGPILALRQITKKIALKNLERSLRGYSFLKGSLENETPLFVFSADPKLFKPIKKLFKNSDKIQYHLLTSRDKTAAQNIIVKNPNSIYLFYVSGGGTARILQGFPEHLKKNIIAINTTYPATLAHYSNYKAIINVYSRNYLTGGWLTEYLFANNEAKNETRVPARVLKLPKKPQKY